MRLLIDTSVLIKWFHDAGESEVAAARAIRDAHIRSELDAHVLDLAIYEVGNVLTRTLKWKARRDRPCPILGSGGIGTGERGTMGSGADPRRLVGMKAVLFDMDGTLVDSEKLWDIAMQRLYAKFGGAMTPEVRESTVGGSSETVLRIVYTDLGLELDPAAMAADADWLHEITGELFDAGLPWCDGARELLDALAEAEVPMALVTNTRRGLTERALNSIGRHYFSASVCGDEVASAKPAPDPYRRAAELLGLDPADCLAIEDSVTGAASAQDAGCPVLVVPNEVEVPIGPRRRTVPSLADVDHATLIRIHRLAAAE